jgi:hypothetical protein
MKLNAKTKKYLKFSGLFILLLFAIFLIFSSIVAIFYGDKVAELIISELNKNIKTELKIGKVNFSVIKKFPNASVELIDVKLLGTNEFDKKQFEKSIVSNIVKAEKIYLSFNIIDVLSEKFEITRLDVENAEISILNDAQNKTNYHFWQESNENEPSKFELILQKVSFKNTDLNFIDKFNKISFSCKLEDCFVSGHFAREGYELKTESQVFIYKVVYNQQVWVKNTTLKADARFFEKSGVFNIDESDLELNDLDFKLELKYNIDAEELSFRLNANDLDYLLFYELVPESIAGYFPNKAKNGEISFKLSYFDGDNSYLKIEKIRAEIDNSTLNLSAKLTQFSSPLLEVDGEMNLDLSEMGNFISPFLSLDSLASYSGSILSNFSYKGKLTKNFKLGYSEGSYLHVDFEADDLKVNWNGKEFIGNMNFSINNNSLEIKELETHFLSSVIKFVGKSENIFDFLAGKSQWLSIKGELNSEHFNAADFLFVDTTKTAENKLDTISSSQTKQSFFQKLNLNLDCKIEAFEYEKFEAEEVHFKLESKSNLLKFNNLEMNALKGKISGNYELIFTDDWINIRSKHSNFEELDVKKAFIAFDNFWQTLLLHENIEGKLWSENTFSLFYDYSFNMLYIKNLVHTKTKLKNGKLLDYQPLESLSNFVKINELKKIEFTELENEFVMQNGIVNVPEMKLNSQILNMSVSGIYNMNSSFQFAIKIGLYSFLTNKLKKRTDFVKDEKAKMGVYLLFSGDSTKYEIAYDKEKIRNILKQNTNYTKEEVSQILKNQYFEKDTLINF